MRTLFTAVLLAGLSIPFASTPSYAQNGVPCGARGRNNRLEMVLLTADQNLFCFRERDRVARNFGPIAGLASGETLVGIDYRPANGMLYGVGTQGGVYTIAGNRGAITATPVASLVDGMGMPVALNGTSFGVDFNPVPDRLRIVSDAGQNLRVNVDTGATLVDTALNLGGVATLGVTAAAYTNNDADMGTLTVLNVLNTTADQLVIQAPPNAGTQNPVGGMKLDAGADASFDIFSNVQNGTTVGVRGLATLSITTTAADGTSSTVTGLYRVNLTTGAVTLAANFGATSIAGLAIPLVQGSAN